MPDARLPSDSEASPAASVPPPGATAHSAAETPGRPGWRRSTDILVRLTVLAAAGGIAILFATQWDRWIGNATRQVTDDAYMFDPGF